MTKKFNTKHPHRSLSGYHALGKNPTKDRYGEFREGRQTSPDIIAGRTLYYGDKKKDKK